MMSPRETLIFMLRMALRKVPAASFRNLAKTQHIAGDLDLAERIVAERILEHLELCGYRIEPGPGVKAHSSPPRR